MFDIRSLFLLGMKRDIGVLVNPGKVQVNLGCGENKIEGAHNLDYPAWDADYDPIPFVDESVDTIHAYHFLEHVKCPVKMLQECQRVLKHSGSMNIVVPYYSSNLFGADLDHKHSFNENTWKVLFSNKYYDKNKLDWLFYVNFNVIVGVEERCLALLTQLVKK